MYTLSTVLFSPFVTQNKEGKPLLLVAAEAGLDDIVAALLIAGADPNSVHAVSYCFADWMTKSRTQNNFSLVAGHVEQPNKF